MAPPNAILEDTATVGGTPGSLDTNEPEVPGQHVAIRARATEQYVAARSQLWYSNYAQGLPIAIDELAQSLGSDIWDRMLFDAQVRSCVNNLKAGILEDGVTVSPAIDDEKEDGYEQAKTIAESAAAMFADLDLDTVLWDMLDAVAMGNRVAEQVYSLDSLNGKTQYVLTRLMVKPRESVAFVVDVYMNVLGVLARIPGQPFGVQQGMLLTSIDQTPNLLPRSKFAVLTFRPHNGNPSGTSCLRAAYDPWNQKQQLKGEYLKYLSQFATPSVIGMTPENAQPYAALNPDGTPQLDSFGNPVYTTPEQALLSALQGLQNGTATAVPFGTDTKLVEMSGDGSAFLNAFEMLDRQIAKAVLHQTLATEEGLHQTRASSGTHKDILDTITRQERRPPQRMLERDVLGTWMLLNGYPKELTPKCTLGTVEQEDMAPMRMAAAAMVKAGLIHKSQLSELDKQLGLPKRNPPDAMGLPVTEMIGVKEDAGTVPPPNPEEAPTVGQNAESDVAGPATEKPIGPVTEPAAV